LGDRIAARAGALHPGQVSPAMAWLFARCFGPLVDLLFRPTISGLDRIPTGRACLLVANHSGGGLADILCLARLWLRHRGQGLAGMAHPVAFVVPGAAAFVRGLGAVPATYDAAGRALEAGVSVLVFPGGDHEAFRPIWQARTVDFAGRKGFLRIAQAARVPIVPIGLTGSHYTNPILWRSRLLPWLAVLPRALGIKRLPISLSWLVGVVAILAQAPFPLALALAFAWSAILVPYFVPLVPYSVKVRVGEPIETFDEPDLERGYARVREAVEALLGPDRPRRSDPG
jgi:1-acyl-sn-glycerol-3-phosphate acyltransferase